MLEGSSGYSKGVLVTGSIKKKEATTYTPGVNNITITKGQYLNGNQVIKGDTNLKPENIKSGVSLFGINGTYTSDATVTSNKILDGESCYVNGAKVEGSLSNKSGLTIEASEVTSDNDYTYISIPETGYYDINSKVKLKDKSLFMSILPHNYSVTYSDIIPEIFYNNHLQITISDYDATVTRFRSNELIDLTNYSYAILTAKVDQYNCPYSFQPGILFGFSKNENISTSDDNLNECDVFLNKKYNNLSGINNANKKSFVLDISNLNGSFYLYIHIANNISRYNAIHSITVGIYDLWLLN